LGYDFEAFFLTKQGEAGMSGSEDSVAKKTLGRIERRILGVLVEKAKTTPDAYPMSLVGLTAGCNQKSNRAPQMQLSEEEVEEGIDILRKAGAATVIQGSGRVLKFRHLAYEWFGVNGHQAALMTELLLRGPQTVGELRQRASRMEAFADLAIVQQTLQELIDKGLVAAMTPSGRGQVFSHTLYNYDEMAKVREQVSTHATAADSDEPAVNQRLASSGNASSSTSELQSLRQELDDLRAIVQSLQDRLTRLES
jgi:uncharacterized protein